MPGVETGSLLSCARALGLLFACYLAASRLPPPPPPPAAASSFSRYVVIVLQPIESAFCRPRIFLGTNWRQQRPDCLLFFLVSRSYSNCRGKYNNHQRRDDPFFFEEEEEKLAPMGFYTEQLRD